MIYTVILANYGHKTFLDFLNSYCSRINHKLSQENYLYNPIIFYFTIMLRTVIVYKKTSLNQSTVGNLAVVSGMIL